MGTGSRIGILVGDKIHSVEVGYDGYLDGVGKVLLKRFDTQEKVLELIKRNDIRSITEPEIEYYHDEQSECDVDDSGNDFVKRALSRCAEYYYVMENGRWFCGDTYGGTFMSFKFIDLKASIEVEEKTKIAEEAKQRVEEANQLVEEANQRLEDAHRRFKEEEARLRFKETHQEHLIG